MERLDRTIEALCRLPVDFHTEGDVSPIDLIVRSGYPALMSPLRVDRVRRCLGDHPDWVDSWFVWSANQRSSPAWWLAEKSATTYEVGYYDSKLERQEPPLVFDDRVEACAEFMMRAISSIDEN